jgi:hypothetical protein
LETPFLLGELMEIWVADGAEMVVEGGNLGIAAGRRREIKLTVLRMEIQI